MEGTDDEDVQPADREPHDADPLKARVTRLLEAAAGHGGAGGGDDATAQAAVTELLPLVYQQLRAMAQQRMQDQRRDHTLQATALVHEAYARLVGRQDVRWESRAHFFFAAARAMQDILVEHARARGRLKRGGDGHGSPARRVPLNVADLAADVDGDDILSLSDAVRVLEAEQPDVADVVRLRFYAGLTTEQVAAALDISDRQVRRTWAYGRAWLFRRVRMQQDA
ncbi:MAG: hypothetical protein KF817_00885 [Phycisphaeraceae bacterium]|nr:hypothetical protein [Phycisphaeraceae bacterium]